MLESSDQKFKVTVSTVARALRHEVDSVQDLMGQVKGAKETLKKGRKRIAALQIHRLDLSFPFSYSIPPTE